MSKAMQMELAHTPGPWIPDFANREVRVDAILRELRIICTLQRDDERGSNTALIAAAPAMYAALADALAFHEEPGHGNFLKPEHWDAIRKAVKLARAVP